MTEKQGFFSGLKEGDQILLVSHLNGFYLHGTKPSDELRLCEEYSGNSYQMDCDAAKDIVNGLNEALSLGGYQLEVAELRELNDDLQPTDPQWNPPREVGSWGAAHDAYDDESLEYEASWNAFVLIFKKI